MLFLIHLTALGEAHATYTISVAGDQVAADVTLVFAQNLTSAAPVYNITLSGLDASNVTSALSTALATIVPGASASAPSMITYSTGSMTQISLSFNVQGIVTSSNGELRVDLSWKSFKVTTDIENGNITLNQVGRYLESSPFLGRQTSSFIQWTYSEDKTTILTADSVKTAASFNLLDFSGLSKPLESWSQQFNLTGGGTTALTNAETHNFTARETINEGGTPFTTVYFAGYTETAKISISGSPTIHGDSAIIDANNIRIETMMGLIIASPIILVSAVLAERRINRSRRSWSKKIRTR